MKPNKKDRLNEQMRKELFALKFFSLHGIAEDIYRCIITMDFSDAELDLLLSQKNILETLAIEVHDGETYDILIAGTINQFLKTK